MDKAGTVTAAVCGYSDRRFAALASVGVRATARLIAPAPSPVRDPGDDLGGRQVAKQAYAENRQYRHPVVLCRRDLAQILIAKGLNSA